MRAWRVDQGLTLDEVADLTGLSASVLSRCERGLRDLRPSTKVRVARRLGCRVRDLFQVDELADVEAEAPSR